MSGYDAIIIGARVAGSSTARLLARRGLRVLAVDRATFPSDTLSTHQLQLPAVARLKRWGVLDDVVAAGTPATRRVSFDPGPLVIRGEVGRLDGADALYGPRRTLLDELLVESARRAGAEVRERFAVSDVVSEDGRVVGIRGRDAGGEEVTERATIVIGADGRHSLLARAARPRSYDERPALTFAYYTYWDGVPLAGGELYGRERRMVGRGRRTTGS
jgi:flavin-dependent dehydrogenase